MTIIGQVDEVTIKWTLPSDSSGTCWLLPITNMRLVACDLNIIYSCFTFSVRWVKMEMINKIVVAVFYPLLRYGNQARSKVKDSRSRFDQGA
jgi:hypothetical protein